MARVLVLAALLLVHGAQGSPSRPRREGDGPVTCPGFAGYCSESYPGDTCLVVCAFGRNNVPECQADGTWTDIPRCIEHEPGSPEQVPGVCPGIPGYCSLDHTGGLCEFDCLTGPDIRSLCTQDGTWDPYPTCEGDIRETRDGCNPCPGPFGEARNRTLEGGNFAGPQQAAAAPANNNNRNSPPQQQAAQPIRPNNGAANRNGNGNNGQRRPQSNPTVIQPSRQTNFSPVIANEPQQILAPALPVPRPQSQARPQQKQPQQHKQQPQQQKQPAFAAASQGFTAASPAEASRCPGDALEACIDVCPSFSARIFGACVAGCAKRCPNKK